MRGFGRMVPKRLNVCSVTRAAGSEELPPGLPGFSLRGLTEQKGPGPRIGFCSERHACPGFLEEEEFGPAPSLDWGRFLVWSH